MRTLLVDADHYIYRHAAKAQESYKFDEGDPTVVLSPDALITACHELAKDLLELEDTLKADNMILALGASRNWRKDVLPEYKANRTDKARPVLLGDLRSFVEKTWKTHVKPTLEADDVLGILSTAPDIIRGEKIIVSVDKDFMSIPGLLYNPGKPDLGIKKINKDQADYYHAYQTLVGDTCDNYKGCPGIGPKKAQKALEGIQSNEYWGAIVALFEAKGLTEEDALVQARVARICRNEDWDRKEQKVILWNPPGGLKNNIQHHNADGEVIDAI